MLDGAAGKRAADLSEQARHLADALAGLKDLAVAIRQAREPAQGEQLP